MNTYDERFHQQRLTEILEARNTDDVDKSQAIMKLGYDPEVADDLVARHHLGRHQPDYYETLSSLNFAELDDLPLPDRHA